jgi:solute carrier family 8 (sodium/calcium exchanger)
LGPTISEDNLEVDPVELSEAIAHFLTITWKVVFALVPPTHWGGGWPAFVTALTFIGLVTAIVGEVATVFGCVCGMPNSTTAITFVALGTSLPDTFASMTAAKNSQYADSAVGNVTGSNSVNVFLGLGLPWVLASTYDNKYLD